MTGVALVVGAGRGIGANIAARFAREGFTACLVRRSDPEALSESVQLINSEGKGKAHGFLIDATDPTQINETVAEIEEKLGPIEVCVYNLGANMGPRSLDNTPPHIYERAWRLGSWGAYLSAKAVLPRMEERGKGTFIFTGATAGVRGNAGQLAHSNGMMSRRGLAQGLAHEYWPKGIHIAHIIVDGMVDAPDTLGKFFPDAFQKAKAENEGIENIVKPADVADMYWNLHCQSRGTWTFEMDIRPWKEIAWFNSNM